MMALSRSSYSATRVSDCCTSSRELTRCCCKARCMSVIEASTTVNFRDWAVPRAATATATETITAAMAAERTRERSLLDQADAHLSLRDFAADLVRGGSKFRRLPIAKNKCIGGSKSAERWEPRTSLSSRVQRVGGRENRGVLNSYRHRVAAGVEIGGGAIDIGTHIAKAERLERRRRFGRLLTWFSRRRRRRRHKVGVRQWHSRSHSYACVFAIGSDGQVVRKTADPPFTLVSGEHDAYLQRDDSREIGANCRRCDHWSPGSRIRRGVRLLRPRFPDHNHRQAQRCHENAKGYLHCSTPDSTSAAATSGSTVIGSMISGIGGPSS